jgi:prepilin-type N-terminal cleavage/methylation domain-containing protein
MKMKKKVSVEMGFTLLEMIISLTILGIIVAMAGMGIVIGTRGYILTKENTNMSQKAQLALSRLTREMKEVTAIRNENFNDSEAETNYIVYENLQGTRALTREGNYIKMYVLNPGDLVVSGEGDPLLDEISEDSTGFTISLWKGDQSWRTTDDFSDLTRVDIAFTMKRTDSGITEKTFSTAVSPRNRQ